MRTAHPAIDPTPARGQEQHRGHEDRVIGQLPGAGHDEPDACHDGHTGGRRDRACPAAP
jgi:hypothetical protein